LAIAAVAAFAVILPGAANADFKAGSGVTVTFSNPTPGAHSDITVKHTYTYDGVPSGAPGTTGDDLKQWILDTPAGFVGNPNAVPYDERCTQAQMNAYVKSAPLPGTLGQPGQQCPDSAIVGTAKLTLGIDANGGTAAVLTGNIYIVQSAPPLQEVPTTLFTVFKSALPSPPYPAGNFVSAALSRTQIAPVTSGPQGNFQLRSVSEGPIDRPDLSAALGQPAGTTFGHIKNIEQTLLGVLPNGNAFQTNSTRCDAWNSTLYSSTYGTPGGRASQTATLSGTAVGGGDSSDTYAPFAAPAIIPDCSTLAPFTATTTSVLSELKRDSNPALTVTTNNPGAPGTDIPKSIVATLPASITTDLQSPALQAGSLCEPAQADAGACPAGGKIGTASIESPLLIAGLTGDVYAVRGATTVPDLRIFVTGAVSFQLVGNSKFVGVRGNQIQTTFDNLPQNPFTKFVLTINGSAPGQPASILTVSKCPGGNKTPEDGPITYDMASWGGQANTSSYTPALADCFGIAKLAKIKKCVKSTLKVKPVIQSQALLQKTELYVSRGKKLKRVKVYKKYPSNKTLSFRMGSKIKKGKTHKYQVKATYKYTAASPTKHVVKTANSKFKRCK